MTCVYKERSPKIWRHGSYKSGPSLSPPNIAASERVLIIIWWLLFLPVKLLKKIFGQKSKPCVFCSLYPVSRIKSRSLVPASLLPPIVGKHNPPLVQVEFQSVSDRKQQRCWFWHSLGGTFDSESLPTVWSWVYRQSHSQQERQAERQMHKKDWKPIHFW